VVEAAGDLGGSNMIRFEAACDDGPSDVVIAYIPNAGVEDLLGRLQEVPGLRVVLVPRGVLALQPPFSEVSRQIEEVQPRSPIEVFLGGLQSVGSWTAFLGYTAAAGAVVWVDLFTNTAYLLTAAMLIAPFAGPAMNAALATARGDPVLLGRSLVRYMAALILAVIEAAVLSFVLRQEVATSSWCPTARSRRLPCCSRWWRARRGRSTWSSRIETASCRGRPSACSWPRPSRRRPD